MTGPVNESDSAVQLFLSWMEGQDDGEGPTFEELCSLHPGLGPRLNVLRANHERARRLLEPPSEAPAPSTRQPVPAQPNGEPPPPPGRYTIRSQIAEGGMGRILEVYDASLRRTIAMKVLRSENMGPEGPDARRGAQRQSRLLAEAQILGQLDHPGVVSIHELGLDERGQAYFTMKRVRGHDFRVVIRAHHVGDRSWSLPRAVNVLLKVCEAVAYAHAKGVIHRDLKPSNVMVGRFGEVFVMDWGLAKVAGKAEAPPLPLQGMLGATDLHATAPQGAAIHTSAGPELSLVHTDREGELSSTSTAMATAEGSVVGTPGFMAPEQARGELDGCDARVDVYALGAMLYHLLAGKHPHAVRDRSAGSREIVAAVLAGPPERLARLAPRAPEELVAIAEKAMAREPARRYATVLELAEDLGAWLEGRVVRAHRTGAWVELEKWVGRNRGAAAAVLAIVVGLGTTTAVQSLRKRDVERARRETESRAEELRREDAHNRVALASAALSNGDTSHLRELLEGCPEDLRGWEWRHLWRESDTSEPVLERPELDLKSVLFLGEDTLVTAGTGTPDRILVCAPESGEVRHEIALGEGASINNVSLSGDGTLLAMFAQLGELCLWETGGWQALPSLDARLHGWHGVAFAPSGHVLAAYATEGVQLWDVDRREDLALLSAEQADIADVAWSPDGRALHAASWDGSLSVWDVESLSLVKVLRDSTHRMQTVECSPDGRWIAGGDWDSRLFVWDARTLELVHRSDRVGGHVWALAWSPDSSLLAVGGVAPVVRVFEAGSWEILGRLVGNTGAVSALEFEPGGRRLYSGCARGTVRRWDLQRPDWRTQRRQHGREPAAGIAFSGDGKRAAVGWGHGVIEIWDVAERAVDREFRVAPPLRHLDWSSDGTCLAVARWEEDILLLDPWDGSTRRRLPLIEPTEVHFEPGGLRLAAAANDGFLRVWDERGELAWQARVPLETTGWPGNLFGASWSSDGGEIVACSYDGRIQVRDSASGALLRETRRPGMIFAQFSRGGREILASAYSDNQGMELLDADTLEPRWTVGETLHMWPVLASTGERVFSANWLGWLGVWEARSGRLVAEIEGLPPGNPRLSVSPDGSCVLLAGGKNIGFFDTRPVR